MPLGTAKDSIADLQSLVRGASGFDEDYTTAPAATASAFSHDEDEDEDGNFFMDAQEEEEEEEFEESINIPAATAAAAQPSSSATLPVPMSLDGASLIEQTEVMAGIVDMTMTVELPTNDYDYGSNYGSGLRRTSSSSASPSRRSNSTPYKKNPYSRNDDVTKKTTTAYSNYYDYTDYYAQSYTDQSLSSSPPKKKQNNVLTCLFPFLQDPLDTDSDLEDDDDDDNDDSDDDDLSDDEPTTDEQSHGTAPSIILSEGSSVAGSEHLQNQNHETIDVRNAQASVDNGPTSSHNKVHPSSDAATATVTVTPRVGAASTPSTSASSSPEPELDTQGSGLGPVSGPASASQSPNVVHPKQQQQQQQQPPPPKPKKPLKGILKRTVLRPQTPIIKTTESLQKTLMKNSLRASARGGIGTDLDGKNVQRRSILPTYSTDNYHMNANATAMTTSQRAGIGSMLSGSFSDDGSNHATHRPTNEKKKKVSFSSMARVLPVQARTDMSFYMKSLIWWQRNDYDDFKKTGRIIAKAMLQGGSEIWLQTSNAWGKQQSRTSGSGSGSGNHGGSTSHKKNNSAEYLSALKRYGVRIDNEGGGDDDDDEEKNNDEDGGDLNEKWWCKFGHSRRGLEHIVSIQEGRQRQKLVNSSIQSVLDEQRRQRVSSRKDPHKIASISMQYTSWAKDLALAAGEADEEAVRKNFHSKAKGRLAYLSSKLLSRGNRGNTAKEGQPCASLILSANPAVTAGLLDSHTHTHTHGRNNVKNVLRQKKKEEEEKRKEMHLQQRAASVMKNDHSIAHQAAGFQFQEAIGS